MSKKKTLKRLLKIFLPLGLGIFFVLYSFHTFSEQQREQIFTNIQHVSGVWIGMALLGGIIAHLIRALRWKLLFKPMGYSARTSLTFMAVMAGYLANLGIPRSGEVLRAATLSSYEKIPLNKVLGTIVAERAVDVIMVLLIVVLAISLHTTELLDFFNFYRINPWFILLGMLGLIVLGVIGLQIIKKLKVGFFSRVKRFLVGILVGVKSIFNLEQKRLFLLYTFLIWGVYVLTFYLLKFAFSEMNSLSFGVMLVAFIAGSFTVSITNSGLGIYPIAVGVALSFFGITKETGEAFGWVDWGTQTLLSVIIGGASLILMPLLFKKEINS